MWYENGSLDFEKPKSGNRMAKKHLEVAGFYREKMEGQGLSDEDFCDWWKKEGF